MKQTSTVMLCALLIAAPAVVYGQDEPGGLFGLLTGSGKKPTPVAEEPALEEEEEAAPPLAAEEPAAEEPSAEEEKKAAEEAAPAPSRDGVVESPATAPVPSEEASSPSAPDAPAVEAAKPAAPIVPEPAVAAPEKPSDAPVVAVPPPPASPEEEVTAIEPPKPESPGDAEPSLAAPSSAEPAEPEPRVPASEERDALASRPPDGGRVAPGEVDLPETEIQGELEKPDIFFLLPKARDQSDDQVIRARIRREITRPLVKEWLEEMMLLK